MKSFALLFLCIWAGASYGAIESAVDLQHRIEERLAALFAEKDLRLSDHAVLLASRYRKLLIEPMAEDARRGALERLLARCDAPAPRGDVQEDLARVAAPALVDGGSRASLKAALAWALSAARKDKRERLPFGRRTVKRTDLVASIALFAELVERTPDPAELMKVLAASFDVYRSPGLAPSHDVLFTAYHDPVFEGRLTPDATFRWPAYAPPSRAGLANERYSRADVARGALAGKGLELVYLGDPLDAFLLEVEGSGLVHLPDGRCVKLEFAAKNGKPYASLGKAMVRLGYLKPWEMSVPAIRQYLRREPSKLRATLDLNPCQVYFRATMLPEVPRTLEYIAERSVACDQTYFPKAGIGFALLERPVPGPDGGPARWVPHARFIVNHDTGAAVRGPGHIDLYWGHARDSGEVAGLMREPGELYYFLKKGTPLSQRR